MSSPLSMLKKTRRLPLQGSLDQEQGPSGRVPFKDNLTRKYEEIISGLHPPTVSQRPDDNVSTSTSKSLSNTLSNGIPPSDYELMSSMMQRLACLERTLKIQAHQIEHKDKRISVLEEKLRLLKNTETASDLPDKDDLVNTCSRLQTQVHEMENFLSEYGMIWVGDGDSSKTSEEGEDNESFQRQSSSDRDTWQPGRKTTMDQFLNRLPKVVVKAGRVIDIRDSVQAVLQGQSDIRNSVILVETPVLQAMKERLEMCDSERPPSACDVTTLRVKSEDGENSYILKMRFSETIGHLRQYLDRHRGTAVTDYDVFSVFPLRCYDDNSHTLLSCGLTPNAALLLRTRISCSQTN